MRLFFLSLHALDKTICRLTAVSATEAGQFLVLLSSFTSFYVPEERQRYLQQISCELMMKKQKQT